MNPTHIKVRQEKKAFRQIIEAILVMIADGTLEYGSSLYNEEELCQMLGVSRPTLREALRAMEILGIVTVRPRKGIMLNRPNYDEGYLPISYILSFEKTSAQEILELRSAIQIEMVYQAALNRSQEQLDKLMEILKKAEEDGDMDNKEFTAYDEKFHQQIILCSGNMLAYKMMLTLSSIIENHLMDISRVKSPGRRAITLSHHREIADCIANKDPLGAQAMMRVHLNRTKHMVPNDLVVHFNPEED